MLVFIDVVCVSGHFIVTCSVAVLLKLPAFYQRGICPRLASLIKTLKSTEKNTFVLFTDTPGFGIVTTPL